MPAARPPAFRRRGVELARAREKPIAEIAPSATKMMIAITTPTIAMVVY